MNVLIALLVLGSVYGCATRTRHSVAVLISPSSIRDGSPGKVSDARADLATQLSRRGLVVINDHMSADYSLHLAYQPVSRHPSMEELVEVRMERNPLKERPLTSQGSLRLNSKITNNISGTEPLWSRG